MDDLDEYQKRRKAADARRRRSAAAGGGIFRASGSFWKRFFVRLLMFGGLAAVLFSCLGYGLFMVLTAKYQKWADEFDLEDINNLDHPCIIYDRHGAEIGRIFDENRSYVSVDKISKSMIDALVAQEDKTFWTHDGFDPVGIARAAKEALMAHGKANQGASTITQQLARNAYDLERRTEARGGNRYERKVVEIFLARRIEKKYDKRQILEFYLNRIYFGRGYYGIRSASLGYFGKEPADLTVREAASIAALIKNPENYNPIRNPELNFRWRNDVVDRMKRSGYLTSDEAERVKKQPLGLNPAPLRRNTSFLHALVQQQAIDLFQSKERGEEIIKSRGIKIYTTIDKGMQEAAEASMQAQIAQIEGRKGYAHEKLADLKDPRTNRHRYLDGMVYAVDNETGGVLAYVAGRCFERDNFDLIEHGRRPAGTAFLPFLYLAAFENGYSPCARLVDDAMDNRLAGIGGAEGILGEWGMETDKGRYMDAVTMRQSLAWSKIASSARLGIALGADPHRASRSFVETLSRVGITPPPRNSGSTEARPVYYPRVYLGTESVSFKELVMAYTVFPNGGRRPISPYIMTKVTDSNGSILWENPLAVSHRMVRSVSPCNAYRVHSMMRESLTRGSAQRVQPFLPADFKGAVKTGTNYDFADNVLIGYNSSFTCGAWLGFLNDRHAIYEEAFSSDTLSPVVGAVFRYAAEAKLPDEPIAVPNDTEEVEICRYSGQLATNFCFETTTNARNGGIRPTYLEYFPKGDVSLGYCSVHGDGAPSLGDFLDANANSLTSTRVLPVVPILPKGSPLTGDDPYGCEVELHPRYRDSGELVHSGSGFGDSDIAVDDEADEADLPALDCTIPLAPPRQMRQLPVIPIETSL